MLGDGVGDACVPAITARPRPAGLGSTWWQLRPSAVELEAGRASSCRDRTRASRMGRIASASRNASTSARTRCRIAQLRTSCDSCCGSTAAVQRP